MPRRVGDDIALVMAMREAFAPLDRVREIAGGDAGVLLDLLCHANPYRDRLRCVTGRTRSRGRSVGCPGNHRWSGRRLRR